MENEPTLRTPNEIEEKAKELGATNDNTIVVIHPPHRIPQNERIFIAEVVRTETAGLSASIKRVLNGKRNPLHMNMPDSVRKSIERRHRQSYEACSTRTMMIPPAQRYVKPKETWVPPVEVDDLLPDILPSPKVSQRHEEMKKRQEEKKTEDTFKNIEMMFNTPPMLTPESVKLNNEPWYDLTSMETPE